MFLQVIGLGKSGKAAARLALARGASVVAIDQNKNVGLLEVWPSLYSILCVCIYICRTQELSST